MITEQDKVALDEVSRAWNEAMDEIEQDSEKYWNSLSKEDQLKVFCAVSRRIYKGDIVEQGTYRYVLYNVFEFGPEAYAPAQLAGYLAIHNAIYSETHEQDVLETFAQKCFGVDKEVAKQKVMEFYL
jgi:hypothetical protein